mmetsp:Transcript_39499/g.70874  ORF Transcript_39499/g.70874 Transcript_39499/m.70874 type:complete len:95 (-) Transcript_39499:200-484(-)
MRGTKASLLALPRGPWFRAACLKGPGGLLCWGWGTDGGGTICSGGWEEYLGGRYSYSSPKQTGTVRLPNPACTWWDVQSAACTWGASPGPRIRR